MGPIVIALAAGGIIAGAILTGEERIIAAACVGEIVFFIAWGIAAIAQSDGDPW